METRRYDIRLRKALAFLLDSAFAKNTVKPKSCSSQGRASNPSLGLGAVKLLAITSSSCCQSFFAKALQYFVVQQILELCYHMQKGWLHYVLWIKLLHTEPQEGVETLTPSFCALGAAAELSGFIFFFYHQWMHGNVCCGCFASILYT